MKKAILLLAMIFVSTIATSQQVQQCGPGKVPLCLCACVTPEKNECETPPADLPNAPTIQGAMIQYFVSQAPLSLKPWLESALGWDKEDLESGMVEMVTAARCFSGMKPGPVNPASIGADEIKGWVLAVLESKDVKYKALIPIVKAIPSKDVCTAYRRAVEVKRGKPFGLYGNC